MNAILQSSLKKIRLSLFLAAIGLAPLLWAFSEVLWQRPAYQFFPLALLLAGMLAWRAVREFGTEVAPDDARLSWVFAGTAGLVFIAANLFWSPWLGIVALLLVLATIIWHLGGSRAFGIFLPALLVLASIVPPPLGWDTQLTTWLRTVAVSASSSLLDFLHIIHAREGNTLLLPGKSLLVAEACSGINSVVLCGCLCLFYGLWRRRPLTWLLVMVPAAWTFVLLGNIIRITTGAALYYYYRKDLLSGWPHEIFGLVLLLSYVGLIWSLDELLYFLTQQPKSLSTDAPEENFEVQPNLQTSAGTFKPMVITYGGWVLLVVGVGFFTARLCFGGVHAVAIAPNLGQPRDLKLSLPAEVAGWHQAAAPETALAETLGVHSVLWRFTHDGAEAIVAADYPLEGFHNVRSCYQNNGWQVKSEEKLSFDEGGPVRPVFKETMQRSTCQNAVVFHAVLNERGQWLQPQVKKGEFTSRLFGDDPVAYQTSYRIQVLVGGYAPLSDEVIASERELFSQSSQLLKEELVSQFPKSEGR